MPAYNFTFQTPPTTVMGPVPDQVVIIFDRIKGNPSHTGPAGPSPTVNATRDIIRYGGTLTNGNHFGECDISIGGIHQKEEVIPPKMPPGLSPLGQFLWGLGQLFSGTKTKWVDEPFVGTSHITIAPPAKPVFTPDPLTVPKGKPGPHANFEVQVMPPGPYDIVLRVHNVDGPPGLFVPTLVHTGPDGKGASYIQDLIDMKRGPISISATISPQSPCTGASVETTFTVNVT